MKVNKEINISFDLNIQMLLQVKSYENTKSREDRNRPSFSININHNFGVAADILISTYPQNYFHKNTMKYCAISIW